jgi:TPR repeat protein
MYNLARLYQTGDAGEQNIPEAMTWYQRAADAGNADAAEQLKKLKALQTNAQP